MSKTNIRYRGVRPVVDTTYPAEFDIAELRLPEDFLEKVAGNLLAITFSTHDRVFGGVRVRQIDEYDVIFHVGRQEERVVITIGGFLRHSEGSSTDRILKKFETISNVRGAFGL